MLFCSPFPRSTNFNRLFCHRFCFFSLMTATLAPICVNAQSAGELVVRADQLADQSDWHDAGALYAKAETEYHRAGDTRGEMYAKLGRLHRDLGNGSYTAIRAEVSRMLRDQIPESDPALRIRALALLGNIDINIDGAAAIRDWTEVLATAKKAGDEKWENRARGELGLIAGINGNLGAAGQALYAAIAKADQIGDISAHINFTTWLVNGMAVHGMADRAVLVDQTIAYTKKGGYVNPVLSKNANALKIGQMAVRAPF
jgi:hypothetical protein